MVLLEVNGGTASSPTEVIVIGILALAIVAIGLLLFRSLKKITVPYADEIPGAGVPGAETPGPDAPGAEASGDATAGDDPDTRRGSDRS